MHSGPPTDHDLLNRFHERGDRHALALLFERHRALAYRVSLGVLGRPADAEDAAQEAFLRLIRSSPRDPGDGSLAGLIARMALRSAQDLARSAARRRAREAACALPDRSEAPEPDAAFAAREEQRHVLRAVDALDDRYRIPVVLHYLEGLSTRETAEALGLTQTAVTTRLSRAVGKLRERLRREGILLGAPALAAILAARPVEATPATLSARLEVLAAGAAPAPSAGVAAAGIGAGALGAKLAVAGLVVAASLGGIATLRRVPPPPAGAAVVNSAPGRSPEASATPKNAAARSGPSSPAAPASASPSPRAGHTPKGSILARHHGLRVPVRVASARSVPLQSPPPSGAAPGPVPHAPPHGGPSGGTATREAERRLAAAVLEELWRDPDAADYDCRLYLPRAMAMLDPRRAEEWVAGLPVREQTAARVQGLGGMLTSDPDAALDQILRDPDGVIARAAAGEASDGDFASVLIPALYRLAQRDPAQVPALLDRAEAAIRGKGRYAEIALAMCAREVGDPRAPRLAKDLAREHLEYYRKQLRDQPPPNPDAWVLTASQRLANLDTDMALELAGTIQGAYVKRLGPVVIAPGAAQRDLVRAVALLDSSPPGPEGPSVFSWSFQAREVARLLARQDPAAALALAHRLPDASCRAMTLARVAAALPPDEAARVRREAVETARRTGARIAARVAELLPPGPERRRACLLALDMAQAGRDGRDDAPTQLQGPLAVSNPNYSTQVAARVAWCLAPEDPETARLLLEDALSICGEDAQGARVRIWIALAFCAVDPGRAVEVARSIPGEYREARRDALHRIAQLLATPPAQRREAPFSLRAFLPTWLWGYEETTAMMNWEHWDW
ncbi:MAG: RNA polymerase sigma factor [Armatimonadetes bacterium]|nr:RNA polymerase sigma factor [Armatimonadota bacterium]